MLNTTKTKQPLGIPEAGFGWDHDARYYYYDHGPLARTELGDNLVQGVDYAYTLQGWLKGVNSNELDPTKDMGHDGATGPNQNVAADAFSFSLHYNAGDYQSIGGANAQQWLKDMAGTALEADRKDLWNGNIGMMLTNISLPTGLTPGANDRPGLLGNVYAYDQLNRLKEARSDWNNASGFGASYQTTDMYLNTFNYDANGNILKQLRKDQLASTIDDLRYTYKGAVDANGMITSSMNSNRLYSVYDQLGASTFDDDIDAEDMTGATYDYQTNTTGIESNGNYQYTKIGELKSDEQEQIEEILWRVDSKISEVRRTSSSSKKTLRFAYNAMGNRTAKYVYNDAAMTQLHSSTYYVHDASGNVMAVYEKLEVATNARSTNFALIERHIFGSSRLGMDNSPVEYLSESPAGRAPYSPDDAQIIRILSQKQYELTNHLGNVLATISDRKISSAMFSAEVVSSSDYSPFGAPLQARSFQKENYRFGFNGQENEIQISGYETHTSAEFWMYDSRLGRRWEMDPVNQEALSPFSCLANNPIWCNDINGDTPDPKSGDPGTHTVQKGDTFWAIENALGMEHGALAELNPDVEPKNLQVGQVLITEPDIPVNEPFMEGTGLRNLEPGEADSKLASIALPVGGLGQLGNLGTAIWSGLAAYSEVESIASTSATTSTSGEIMNQSEFGYATYRKVNYITGKVYIGRTSGYGGAERIVTLRDAQHRAKSPHLKDFGPAEVTSYQRSNYHGFGARGMDPAYWSNRGMEQVQIAYWRKLNLSANINNGISPTNGKANKYFTEAWKLLFKD